MKRLVQTLVSAVAALSLVTTAAAAENALERVKKAGKLVVAIDATYPPMEFEGKDGKPEGFDIDFATEVASRVGVKPEFVVVAWDGVIAGLYSKRYDVIISTMNITDERKKQVDFVEYARMSQLFVAKKGVNVASEKDLTGKVVAVQADTTGHEWVEKQQKAGIKLKEVKAFRAATDLFAAVKAGQAEVIVVDEPVGRYYTKQDPATFVVTGRAIQPEPIGVAVRKEDAALRQGIEAAVDAMKKDGSLKKLHEKWFGGELGA
jgi:polar amino acid transport system substrate-binding protein